MNINIRNKIQSEIIIIPQPHIGENIVVDELEFIDAFFTTVNGGFGGYSYHSTNMLLKEIYERRGEKWNFDVNRRMINNAKFPDLDSISELNPPFIQTTTVKSPGWSGARNLMNQILKYASENNFKKIRLTQMIHLRSQQSALFKNIAQAMNESFELLPSKIIFDIDENYYKQFITILNSVMDKNFGS